MATAKEPEVKKVQINIPLTREEREPVWVCVNGESYLIKRGEYVEVPEYVAQVLKQKERMLALAMAYEDEAAAPLTAMAQM